jgi:hypothetical protein
MKKITLILAFIGMITLQSCTNEDDQINNDNDTISEVFEYTNVNFTSGNGYSQILDFPYAIYTSDMVLVYRLAGTDAGRDVWKLLPETYYYDDGTLDFGYSNDFTNINAVVNLFGYDLPGLSSSYRLNQIIRVLVIPAFENNRMANPVDLNDYNAVIEYYNINDKNVDEIKL